LTLEPELNKTEVWIAEHAIRILLVFAVAILVGGYFVYKTVEQTGQTSKTVRRIEPQVTKINRAICDERSLESPGRARRCAERIRIGLVNCRSSEPCRAAFLAITTYPPPARSTSTSTTATTTALSSKGVMPQQPSHHGHQQPDPSTGPHGGNGKGGGEAAPESPPAASPGPSGGEGGSGAGQGQESPGNGAQGGSTSGAGVEVCALERTCIGVEVGVGN
jgi:hypothetical protein